MAETLNDLITEAMLIVGALGQGETPSAEESADGLLATNNMLDRWNADRLNIYNLTDNSYTLSANVGDYTLGPSGSLTAAVRPARIVRANIKVSGLVLPLDVYNAEQWATISETSNAAILPTVVYPVFTFPNIELHFNPVPLCSTTTKAEIFAWNLLSQFAATTDSVLIFPPAYIEAITYNLAVRLYPRFGIQADPVVMQIAEDSKASMRQLNAENGLISMPSMPAAPVQQAPAA